MNTSFSNAQIPIDDIAEFEKVDFHPVEKQLRTKSLVILSIFTSISLIGLLLYLFTSEYNLAILFVFSFVFLLLGIIALDIILRQKHYGYAIREQDIIFKKGYIFTKTTIVPFNRIQHLSVNQSLFDKLYKLSSLHIYTAGGNKSDISIPGLNPETAKDINEFLSKKILRNA